MNRTFLRIISLIALVCLAIGCFAGCNETPEDTTGSTAASGTGTEATEALGEFIDYAAQLKLDMTSDTKKVEVTVKTYVDGDTTHFNIDESEIEGGVLKARYLAINTPESTGKIEEYGKKASNFTKEALSSATSIIVESDDSNWNIDSTGSRCLVWVWYKTDDMEDYRNLNLEILQNGLAVASSTANNRYGDTCMAALNQAKAFGLNLYSGEEDPDFYYGDAQELTLKELRTNIESYSGCKVAFNGIITMNDSNSVYVEDYDEETGLYYGMTVYYGYNLSGAGLEILTVGNEVRIVGTVQYYETGGTWQVSGLTYRQMKPDDPDNIQKISEGNTAAFTLTDPDTFANGTVDIDVNEETVTFDYAELALSTTVEMTDLYVVDVYTTSNTDSSSYGAMTLTCTVDGVTISVRTVVLYDDNGDMITASAYLGKTIDVKGIVDYYDGTYQIKVFDDSYITIHD